MLHVLNYNIVRKHANFKLSLHHIAPDYLLIVEHHLKVVLNLIVDFARAKFVHFVCWAEERLME